jgi:hypothetical protein
MNRKVITVPKKKRVNSVFTKSSRKEIAKNVHSPFRSSLPKSYRKGRIVRKNVPVRPFFFNVKIEDRVIEHGQLHSVATIVICLYLHNRYPRATEIHVWKSSN